MCVWCVCMYVRCMCLWCVVYMYVCEVYVFVCVCVCVCVCGVVWDFEILFLFYVYGCFACVYACMCVQCPQRQERGIGSSGTGLSATMWVLGTKLRFPLLLMA